MSRGYEGLDLFVASKCGVGTLMICDDYDFGLLLNASPCFALVIMQTLADG